MTEMQPELSGRNVGTGRVIENEVREHRAPGTALRIRQGAQRRDGMHQAVERRPSPGGGARPPVVHKHVEGAGHLHVVPPHVWDVESIAGFEIGSEARVERRAEFRIANEIRRLEHDTRVFLRGPHPRGRDARNVGPRHRGDEKLRRRHQQPPAHAATLEPYRDSVRAGYAFTHG